MEPVSGAWAYLLVFASLALSAIIAALAVGSRIRVPAQARSLDHEPHTLMLIGPDGRPNPAAYENFPDYFSALKRQRDLDRRRHASVVIHTETGQVRFDPEQMAGAFRRIHL